MTNVNKKLNNIEEVKKMKEKNKKIIKIFIFFLIASFPFISITQILGFETFLDSFENPESYLCFQDTSGLYASKSNNKQYIIIQKSTHPDFKFDDNDDIIYYKYSGKLECGKLKQKNYFHSLKAYCEIGKTEEESNPIYEHQIIGKIIQKVDENIFNIISIELWEISIHNLNIRALQTS